MNKSILPSSIAQSNLKSSIFKNTLFHFFKMSALNVWRNAMIFIFMLSSIMVSAQGELKLTITNSYIATTTASGAITISIYDAAGTTLLHTYNNASNAQVINPADWGAPAATTYQAWYSNNITSFTPNANTGFNPRIQSIDQWGTATFNSLSFFNATNMEIAATDAPVFAPDANLGGLFHSCTSMTDPGDNVPTWDTSNVKFLQGAFNNTDNYNPTNLGNWDVGNVTNFINIFFANNTFNDASINNWNIGENTGTNPINMEGMFYGALSFNQPLNGWERAPGTLGGTDPGSSLQYVFRTRNMFRNARNFNQNIGNWNLGRVTDFHAMFYTDAGQATAFNNGDPAAATIDEATGVGIGLRDLIIGSNLTPTQTIDMTYMFATNRINERNDHFNQDLSNWDVTKVTNFGFMFRFCTVFTGDGGVELAAGTEQDASGLSNWRIGGTNTNPISMSTMFLSAQVFNESLAAWETNAGSTMGYVNNMVNMFYNAYAFNQDLGPWNVGRVTSFHQTFYGQAGINSFNNGDAAGVIGTGLQNWNIGANVPAGTTIDMYRMFRNCRSFNQDLSNWDVTKVNRFSQMFFDNYLFEGLGTPTWKISGTNTHNVVMDNMFGNARVFNQPLAAWETDSGSTMAYVTNTSSMFNGALIFNQAIGDWDVGRVTNFGSMFQSTNAYNDPTINNWNIGENTGTNAINMASMFNSGNAFNQPLDGWQNNADSTLEYVTNMSTMFANADVFNQDISVWDVGRVTNFSQMFLWNAQTATVFNNGDAPGVVGTNLQNWNIGENLTGNQTITMFRMFRNADQFNQNLSGWDVRRVTNFQETFWATNVFTGAGLRDWQISGSNTFAINMQNMFGGAVSFVEPLATWETDAGSTMGYVTNMREMFNNADSFDHPIGIWDVGRVTNFIYMFANNNGFTDPEPSIANWNIGQNTGTTGINMQGMFQANTAFNNSLEDWERTANTPDKDPRPSTMAYVGSLRDMFRNGAIFNNTINTWDVGRVGDFHAMFFTNPNFNQPVNNWNIGENRGGNINMQYMFGPATAFNQPLNNWDVSKVRYYLNMFNGATSFDQSLAAWTPVTGTQFNNMLSNSGLSVANYDATLTSWAQQDLIDNQALGAVNLEFCAAEPFRASLVGDQGWTISGDLLGCAPGNVSGAGKLLYWVTAGSHVGNDGDPVDEWRDISGDGRIFSQATTGNQPTFLKNTTDMVNFNPLVRFDGADDFMQGFDFNAHDLSFPNTPRVNLAIVGRTASSELSVTTNPPPPQNPVTYTFTANNSVLGNNFNGSNAPGSWRPENLPTENNNTTEYLQLDLGEIVPLSTIRTRGERANAQGNNYVTSYTVQVSTDGTNFTQVDGTFTGNVNRTDVVLNTFIDNVPAQYVRIYPQTWNGYPALCVGVGTRGYEQASTFVLAVEDTRQDHVIQSINNLDANNLFDISLANTAGVTEANYSFNGGNQVALSSAAPALNNDAVLINYSVSGDGEAKLYRNGVELDSDTTVPKYTLMGTTYLGGLPTSNYFNGKIAEANLFADVLTQEERERINTYFAIKYNIPLEHDMVYEDELTATVETVWDKTTNATYDNDVFALAKDDNQGLNQSVSSSRMLDDKVLTVATVRDFTNLNSDPGRLSLTGTSAFVVIGNDDGDTNFSINNAPNKFKMMGRKWYAQVTGNDQPLFFEFNVGLPSFDIPDTEQTPDYYLVIDSNSNGDLSDDQPVLMTNTSGDLWSTPDAVTVADGQIFTVAYVFSVFPGGVANDLALWLKADAELYNNDDAVSLWADQSVINNNATENSNQPNFKNNITDNINHNPVVAFNGTDDRLNIDPSLLPLSSDGRSFFAVALPTSTNSSPIISYGEFVGVESSTFLLSQDEIRQQFANGGRFDSHSTSSKPVIGTSYYDDAQQSGTTALRLDGLALTGTASSGNTIPNTTTVNGGFIGRRFRSFVNQNDFFEGTIAEVIAYDGDISAFSEDIPRIESYLALKYGITLNQDTATDYVASDWDGTTGTLMWDSSVDANYNSDIFGIGQDEAGGFNQKIAKSVNANTIMTVSLDDDDFTKANKAVVNGHTNNLQFLSFASNGLDATDQITELDAAKYNLGIAREWQVYKTANFDEAVNLKFEGFGGFDVIQSTDSDFSTDGDQTVLGTLDANGELTNVTGLVNGSYISLAINLQAPGGVTAELGLWLKANGNVFNTATTQATDGETVETWVDYSLNTNNGNETTNQPDFRNNSVDNINFNPVVDFNGTDDQLVLDASYFPSGSESRSYFAVGLPNTGAAANNHPVLDHGNGLTGRSNFTLSPTSVSTSTGESNYIAAHSIATPFIGSGTYPEDSPLNAYTFKANGAVLTASGANTIAVPNTINTNAFIGRLTNDPTFYYGGTIAEVIAYNNDIGANPTDELKIQSYLAIKYGITLDASIADYVNTAGTSIYNLTSYNNDVFGIGNDVPQALNQEISKSVNSGAIVTISTDTDFTAVNGMHTPLNDGQYLVIGNDGTSGAIPSTQNTTDLDTSKYFNRVAREWKSTNTGSVGEVNLQFDGFDANWVLLTRATDGDFSATTGTTETQLSASGTVAVTLPATSYFTVAQKPIAIEFQAATASDVEATGGNLPNLIIDGELTADATIDVVVNAAGTATANTDYTFGNATGDGTTTITATILAGVYSAANPLPMVTTLVDDIALDVSYASLTNPPAVFEQETFVPTQTGDYILRHSAETVNSGNGWVNIGTTASGGVGSSDVYDGVNGGERVDAANLVRTRTISLIAGTTYYLTTGAGGNSNLDNVRVFITHPVVLSITDDNIVEADETISLSLSNPNNGLKIENVTGTDLIDTHVYTIANDDTATVTIAADADADETISTRAFTLNMSEVASTAIDVNYTLTGTANNPDDYADATAVVGTVTIPAGSSSATIDITVVDDTNAELTETVIATLTAATNNASVTGDTTAATMNITDDDLAALTISIGTPVDGTEGTSDVSFEVSLDAGVTNTTGAAITGTLVLTGTATNGTDYTDITTFSIADGDSSTTVTVSVTDDALVEVSETVIATISNPSVGSIATASATANILDDDLAALTISIGTPVDGTEGTSDVSFEVSLDAGVTNTTGAAITGTLVLTGTATNGTDYTDITTFSIADGDSSTTVTVSVTDDALVEVSETVIATISNPSVGSIATASATANILDDDTAEVTIMADADADESISNRTFILTMDKAVPSDVEVNYVLSGSALNPDDFSDVTAVQGVATIPQGFTTTTINLSIVDDNVVEANETIVASLQATTSSAVVTAATTPATLIIIDNDEILVSITGDTEADEAVSTRNFTISLAEPASIDVLIDYTLSGTALNFDDFTDLSGGSVLIPIGSTATTINIEVIDDSLVEDTENIQATISSSLDAVTITQATAMLNILDNDMCTPPTNLEVTDIQIATVDLSWSMPTDVSFVGFEWVIMNAGDDPLTAVPVAFDFTLDNVTNVADAGVLIKDTSYDFYVRTMCTSDVYSAFNGPITFNTLPDNDDDGIPDGIDEDDDNDGISDLEEGKGDCDNDGIPDDFDPDACTITTNDIATAFTPNGDNLNDTWVIKGIENFPNSVVSVFNRWGHEVFKAQGYQNDWSAAYKDNSRMLPPGSYYFVINLGDGTKPIDGWLFINY